MLFSLLLACPIVAGALATPTVEQSELIRLRARVTELEAATATCACPQGVVTGLGEHRGRSATEAAADGAASEHGASSEHGATGEHGAAHTIFNMPEHFDKDFLIMMIVRRPSHAPPLPWRVRGTPQPDERHMCRWDRGCWSS